jgi:hypothetical protein
LNEKVKEKNDHSFKMIEKQNEMTEISREMNEKPQGNNRKTDFSLKNNYQRSKKNSK